MQKKSNTADGSQNSNLFMLELTEKLKARNTESTEVKQAARDATSDSDSLATESHDEMSETTTSNLGQRYQLDVLDDDDDEITFDIDIDQDEETTQFNEEPKPTIRQSFRQRLFSFLETKKDEPNEQEIRDFSNDLLSMLEHRLSEQSIQFIKTDVISPIHAAIEYRKKHMFLRDPGIANLKESMFTGAIDQLYKRFTEHEQQKGMTNREALQIIIQMAKVNNIIEFDKPNLKNFDARYLFKSSLERMLDEVKDAEIIAWLSKDEYELKNLLKSEINTSIGLSGETLVGQFIKLKQEMFTSPNLAKLKENSAAIIALIKEKEPVEQEDLKRLRRRGLSLKNNV